MSFYRATSFSVKKGKYLTIDPLAFGNVNPKVVGNAVFEIIDRIQTHPKHVQAHALAISFILFCEEQSLSLQDTFEKAKNLLNHHEASTHPEIRAAREFIQREVL